MTLCRILLMGGRLDKYVQEYKEKKSDKSELTCQSPGQNGSQQLKK